jgi:hypothetical protein
MKLHSSPPCTVSIQGLESLFTMPAPSGFGYERILGVSADFTIFQLQATEEPSLSLVGQHKLPLSCTPRFILPVDPMAWRRSHDWTTYGVLLSISENGDIAFWIPETSSANGWKCTSQVRTGRTGFRKVRCSSAKKTVLS